MEILTTVITVLLVLVGIVLIAFILFQSGKHSGLGVIGGASDSFLSKNKARSMDAKLAKYTKWVGFVYMVLLLTLCLLPSGV